MCASTCDDLLADLGQQALDPLVLGGDRGKLGARDVELHVEVGGAALELRELGPLPVEGSLQRLLRRAGVGQLRAGSGQFGLGIGGKGRAAGLGCDDVQPTVSRATNVTARLDRRLIER